MTGNRPATIRKLHDGSTATVYKLDSGDHVVSVNGVWCPGAYDSPETAVRAVDDFTDAQLESIAHVWQVDGQGRTATMADLDGLAAAAGSGV